MQNNTSDNQPASQDGKQVVINNNLNTAKEFVSINDAVKLTGKAPNTIRGLINRESNNKSEHFKKVPSPKGDKWFISKEILEQTFEIMAGKQSITDDNHVQNNGTQPDSLYVTQLNNTVKKLENEVEFLREMLKTAQDTIRNKDEQFSTTLTELVSKQNDLMKQLSEENTRVSENFQKLMGMRDKTLLIEDVDTKKKGFFSRIFGE